MYLKSLELKGFKSFADKSVLPFEPGMNAVVGPNGSGKSNISDAVLWVLGERNAKHLRGQAMEDVIFGGSSARKAVSMAEVELVLDNSDGTLPVDYSEVSIMRRLYRSGESEYLINGVLSRRMDVLDILHDSGLGTGTHSIISQGSLDSVLQSSPEERRNLIEEAAGVLKHKQRKAKSERKLETMDTHLTRAQDVLHEIERTLKPLERKAKKAQAYKEATSELAELTLLLAVDDLRNLKREWEALAATETNLNSVLGNRKEAVDALEKEVEKLQDSARIQTTQAQELTRVHRNVTHAQERFDGAVLALRERKRSAHEFEASQALTIERNKVSLEAAKREYENAVSSAKALRDQFESAQKKVTDLEKRCSEASQARQGLENEMRTLEQKRTADQKSADALQRDLEKTKEELATGRAHAKLVETQGKALEEQLHKAEQDAAAAAETLAGAEKALAELVAAESQARAEVVSATKKRDEVKEHLHELEQNLFQISGEISALEKLEEVYLSQNPAQQWIKERYVEEGQEVPLLSHYVSAPEELEALIEAFTAQELSAFLVGDDARAQTFLEQLAQDALPGLATFLAKPQACVLEREVQAFGVALPVGCTPLLDVLTWTEDVDEIMQALFGDVVLCDSEEHAERARHELDVPLRYLVASGTVFFPQGKIVRGIVPQEPEEGVLARRRQLQTAQDNATRVQGDISAAQKELSEADEALRKASEVSLRLVQDLATLRGSTESTRAEASSATERLSATRKECTDLENQRKVAQEAVEKALPCVAELEEKLGMTREAIAKHTARIDEIQRDLIPLRKESGQIRDGLNEAKLTAAKLQERKNYNDRMEETRLHDIERIQKANEEALHEVLVKRVAKMRIDPIMNCLEVLAQSARNRARLLEEQALAAEGSSSDIYNKIDEARQKVKEARDAFDETTAALSDVKVAQGRLEVQVNAKTTAIVEECHTSLEEALLLPALEDRPGAEEQAASLGRKLKAMGTISPDAVEDYEAVKKRYDYLASQMKDLQTARASLARIVRAIDARMREDFERTFVEVDQNFRTVFGELFPGGYAELILVDPEDVEHSGIEVRAQPRGKRISKMTLMSGGEKSLTALALLFAVYRTRTTPFYLLDEVEAALDDSNLRRLIAYLEKLRETTQLIMITHQRRTMETSDVLFGVSMQDGITKVVSQRLEHALRYAE